MFEVEVPQPNSLLEASFLNLSVEMTYSHDLVPLLGLLLVAAVAAYALTRHWSIAFWCLALVVAHEICDLLAGFPHHVMGPASPRVGFGLYIRAPEVALLIEVVFGAICVGWFLRARTTTYRMGLVFDLHSRYPDMVAHCSHFVRKLSTSEPVVSELNRKFITS